MTNNRKKGSCYEREAQKILENDGYTCHRAYASGLPIKDKKTGKQNWFVRSNDVFKVADIVAKKFCQPTRWIQVTTGISNLQPRVKKFVALKIWNDFDSLEVWVRETGAKWRVYQVYPEGEAKCVEIFRLERGKKLVIK